MNIDTLEAFCHKHLTAGSQQLLHAYRLGVDDRYTTEDFVASYDRCIDRDVLAIDHGPGVYVVTVSGESDAVVIDDVRVQITKSFMEEAQKRHPDRVLSKQRDDEAWMHAACLSIAEGCLDWNKPTPMDSLAMIKVRQLRQKYEEAYTSLKAFGNIQADLEAKAYARGILAVKDILAKKFIALSPEVTDALDAAAEAATPFDSVDPEIERLEGLIGDVHDLLWSSENRKESIVDMAKRVKSERDELRKQYDKAVARFLQTDPSLEEVEREKAARARLEAAMKAIADDTDEYRTWVKVMRATQPDAESWSIPKRLIKQGGPGIDVPCNRQFAARAGVGYCELPDGHDGFCRERR